MTLIGNKGDDFISKAELKNYHQGKIKNPLRKAEIAEKIDSESYINRGITLKKHLKDQSEAFKKANPDISLYPIHDRAADSVDYLEFVKQDHW